MIESNKTSLFNPVNKYVVSFNELYSSSLFINSPAGIFLKFILYNDFIVYSILNEVKSLKKKSAMLFLSDHGEDVFDEYQDRLNGKCTKNLAKAFLDENSGVIDF